jgi:hypothetical protein
MIMRYSNNTQPITLLTLNTPFNTLIEIGFGPYLKLPGRIEVSVYELPPVAQTLIRTRIEQEWDETHYDLPFDRVWNAFGLKLTRTLHFEQK